MCLKYNKILTVISRGFWQVISMKLLTWMNEIMVGLKCQEDALDLGIGLKTAA